MVAAAKRARNTRRTGAVLALAGLLTVALVYLAVRSKRGASDRAAPAASAEAGPGAAAPAAPSTPAPGTRQPRVPASMPSAPSAQDDAAATGNATERPNQATPPPSFGDAEANDVFYDKQIAVHEAGRDAAQGPTPCHSAYNSFWAMHVAFYKYEQVRPSEARYPDGRFRTPWDKITEITDEDFVARCQKLPPEMQKCLSYRHYAQAYEECTAVNIAYVDSLTGRAPDFESVDLGMPPPPQLWQGPVRTRWLERQGGSKP